MIFGFESDITKVVVVLSDRYVGLLFNFFFFFYLIIINCYNNLKFKIFFFYRLNIFLNMKNLIEKFEEELDWMVEYIKGN